MMSRVFLESYLSTGFAQRRRGALGEKARKSNCPGTSFPDATDPSFSITPGKTETKHGNGNDSPELRIVAVHKQVHQDTKGPHVDHLVVFLAFKTRNTCKQAQAESLNRACKACCEEVALGILPRGCVDPTVQSILESS